MAFLHRVLSENETLLAIARVHWIHLVKGVLWVLVPLLFWNVLTVLLAGYVYPLLPAAMADAVHMLFYFLFAAFLIMGMVMFALSAIHFLVTEMGLTTKRVIYKTGWAFVQVKEVDLEEIKAADVDTGWLGRFLNYGYLILDSRFVGALNLASISYPYVFLRQLNKARGDLKHDSVNVILDGHESLDNRDMAEATRSMKHEVNEAMEEFSYKPRYVAFEQPKQGPRNDSRNNKPVTEAGRPPTLFMPRKSLHDKILQSFSLANIWR